MAFQEDVRILRQDVILAVRDDVPYLANVLLEGLDGAIFFVYAHFKVPLVGNDAVRNVAFVPFANARAVTVNALANLATEPIEHEPLPFRQTLNYLALELVGRALLQFFRTDRNAAWNVAVRNGKRHGLFALSAVKIIVNTCVFNKSERRRVLCGL